MEESRRDERDAPLVIDGRSLTIFDVVHAARDGRPVALSGEAWEQIRRGRQHVENIIREGGTAYGVTTGVGSQKAASLSKGEIDSFNRRLLVAHATIASRVLLSEQARRAAVVCLINSLASGLSGVRPVIVERLLDVLSRDAVPPANAGASVGASDLVPLAQMATAIFGLAQPFADQAEPASAAEESVELAAKEALSLMNSNAVSLGHGALVLLAARKLLRGFDLSYAMSLEGFRGNPAILSPMVGMANPHTGQRTSSQHLRALLAGSRLMSDPTAPRNLQDPLSFRCAPQNHGATYDTLSWAWQCWEVALNAVTDNPVVDLESGQLISHGNMDTSLLTIALDALRSALANTVGISAQRLHKLHWPAFSGLPSGLTNAPSALGGVQFLNLSHIAEAYAASVRARTHPTLFTYQGQLADGVEDTATMLPLAVSDLEALIDLAWVVQAIELTVAVWSIRRREIPEHELGEGLRPVYRAIEPLLPVGREGGAVFDMRPIVTMTRDEVLVDLIDEDSPPVPEFEPAPADSVVPTED